MNECPRCGWTGGLKPREAAEILGVSHQTVRNQIRAGAIPGVVTVSRPGGMNYWIPVESIRAMRSVDVKPDPGSLHNCPRCGFRAALTPAEAAKELGVGESTVRNRISDGSLAATVEPVSGGHRYWIALETIEAFKEKAAVA